MKDKQLYLTGLEETGHQQNKQREIRLRLDTFILSNLVMVLLLALAFSLGVERGKSLVLAIPQQHNFKTVSIETSEQTPLAIPVSEQTSPQTVEQHHQNNVESATAQPVEKPDREGYRIQVASFRQQDAAKRETQRLIEQGYSAYHNRSGDYIAVYVGGYHNITAAKEALQALRTQYKDCLLKKM